MADTEKQQNKEQKENKETSDECQNLKEKAAELTNLLQHIQADFENYKKRVEKEKTEFKCLAKIELIKKLLPLLDNFELAIKNKDNREEFIKGVELIYSQFVDLLECEGLRKIDAENQKFDPYKHEALMAEKSDKEENTILEEFQKGYMLHDNVIRHSKVKISKH